MILSSTSAIGTMLGLAFILIASVNAFQLPTVRFGRAVSLNTIPLELEGQLDESKSWPVLTPSIYIILNLMHASL